MKYEIYGVIYFPESKKNPAIVKKSFEADSDEAVGIVFQQFVEEEKAKADISARGIKVLLSQEERVVAVKELMFEKSVIETTITPGRGWLEPKDWVYEVQVGENTRRRSSY